VTTATARPPARMAGAQRYEPEAALAELLDHPDNPRQGDDDAVADSIEVNGFYGVIIAQASTRRILAGHTRRRNLMDAGSATGPVLWLDVDDARALRILLADNRTAELAAWIPGKLADVLAAMGADIAGSGFTVADVAIAIAQAADAAGQDRTYDGSRIGSVLVIHAPVDVIERFRALPGTDDLDRLLGLLAQAALCRGGAG
jgi:ParB-like chromosome segregation protein Spo0J